MESSAPQPDERRAPEGRVAVPEIAELLHLQRPAAAIAAAAVVLVGLGVALVVPDVLPPNPITGFGVGLLALLAAATAAVVLDGRDPILRGPRHLRRDGHTVLARMAGPDPVEHGGAVLAALERRLAERDHVSMALTGTGTDASELAVALGRAAAGNGHTALVIDLRAPGAPGVADVGAGTVRLGEAAQLAADRPYAWIGVGTDRSQAVPAAATVARRPPRDLALLLVVAPEAATHAPDLLQACDRTVLLVAADSQQRAMVSARLEALARAGGRPEAIVVGGLHVAAADRDEDGDVEPTPRPTPGGPFARDREAAAEPSAGSPPTAPASPSVVPPPATPTASVPSRSSDVDTSWSSAPADEPGVDSVDEPADEEADESPGSPTGVAGGAGAGAVRVLDEPPAEDAPDEVSPWAGDPSPTEDGASREPDQTDPWAPDTDGPRDATAATDVSWASATEDVQDTTTVADAPDDAEDVADAPDDAEDVADAPDDDEAPDRADAPDAADDRGAREPTGAEQPEGTAPVEELDAATHDASAQDPDEDAHEATDQDRVPSEDMTPPAPGLEDTGPIAPVTFRDAGPEGDESAEGFSASDPMVTTAALEQLLRDQDRED